MASEVLQHNDFSIHVSTERGGPGLPMRCRLQRRAGGPETVLGLPALNHLLGPALSPEELRLLLDNLQATLDAWERCNE